MNYLSNALGDIDYSGMNFGGNFGGVQSFGDALSSTGYDNSGYSSGLDFSSGSPASGGLNLGKGLGYAQQGVGLLNDAFGAYNAYQANKLAKQQFAFQKDAFNKQYAAQKNLTNSQLADRQAQRHRRDPTRYESVDSYMAKYGVK